MARISYLECTKCGLHLEGSLPQTVCPEDGGVLYVRYDLQDLKHHFKPEMLAGGEPSLWRYAEVLPDVVPVTLGEGLTPVIASRKLPHLHVKDEGLNPTGSFKARGMALAVSMARSYGLDKLAAPSAGNAASALAAYAAKAGIEAHLFMPKDVPLANRIECESYGAHVTYVDGLISDCARLLGERKEREGWFDISTLKEPFRLEGKKTMGYEIAEQFGWRLPQGIVYPTGGGVGLLGMWKAFDEMEQLGWIGAERPKMIVVQAAGCAPIVKAFEEGKATSEFWPNAATVASGLRVPKAYGDYLVLDIVRKSGGTALAIEDDETMATVQDAAREEGLFLCPEGAAAMAGYRRLLERGFFQLEDSVVVFNTGSGLKYLDVMESYSRSTRPRPASRQIAGIIGPY